MFENIALHKEGEDGLSSIDWRFNLERDTMVIDYYCVSRRKSKLHDFEVVDCFDRHSKRASTMALTEVPLTEKVKQKVVDTCMAIVQKNLKVNFEK